MIVSTAFRLIVGAGVNVGVADPGAGGATPPADPAPAPGPVPAATPVPAGPAPEEPLGEKGLKALQTERDARAAAEQRANDLAAQVKAFEDAQKTDAEKADEARAELERTSAANAAKALRYEAAEKAGLPLSAAGRLQGATLDELVADAGALKELLGSTGPTTPPAPAPDPSQGRGGGKVAHTTLGGAIGSHYGA